MQAAPICAMPVIPTPDKLADAQFTARAMVVQHFRKYQRAQGLKQTPAVRLYLPFYTALAVQHPGEMPYSVYSTVAERSLYRWLKAEPKELAGHYGGRKGTGILNRANGGAVATYIAALLVDNRHYKGGHMRDLVRAKFGAMLEIDDEMVALPVVRSFERYIKEWKDENAQLFMAMTAPGEFKNKMRIAVGTADARIDRLNQQWQIDASPADAICKDGRYSIYAIIDVWSRRALFSVSKTAKTDGSLLLIRRAIMEWGIPESIKTDNGADFVSQRFKMALLALHIEQEISPPYSPEKKPFVERVIGTMQRDLMAILPGFAGHNVADRQRIRDQKDFAARLGEGADKAFSVELTSTELQAALDNWAAGKYGRNAHDSLGMSPMEKAASWADPVRKPKSIHALDLLLAPIAVGGGMRTVTKYGVRIDGRKYSSGAAAIHIGKDVIVRHDPQDLGRIYAFDADNQFLFEALHPETCGLNPIAYAKQVQAEQAARIAEQKAVINKERRKLNRLDQANAIMSLHQQGTIEAFPHQVEQYSTPALDEALRARTTVTTTAETHGLDIEVEALAKRMAAPVEKKQTDEERWSERLLGIDLQLEAGETLSEKDTLWLARVEKFSWAIAFRNARKREAEAAARHAEFLAQKETPDIENMPGADQ